MHLPLLFFIFFFFNDTATTEIYTLSLHDALPISSFHQQKPITAGQRFENKSCSACCAQLAASTRQLCKSDRKSTRLNSSHSQISYAVFCLKKKKKIQK